MVDVVHCGNVFRPVLYIYIHTQNMGTHSDFIQLEDGSRAFVDGIPDKCDHKEHDDVYQSASGKLIFWYTYRQWAHYNSRMRWELICEYHEDIEDPIVMCTSQCRHCKKIDFPNSLDYQDI